MEFRYMEYKNGQFVSGYTQSDKVFEGYVATRQDGTKVVLNENSKWIRVENLKLVKIIESGDSDILQNRVNDDLNKCDLDKLANLSDDELLKLGDGREKELKSKGLDVSDGDYSNRFMTAVKAQNDANEINAGNLTVSAALEKYKNSKEIDIKNRLKRVLQENYELEDDFTLTDVGFEDFLHDEDSFGMTEDALEDAKTFIDTAYIDTWNEDDLVDEIGESYEVSDGEAAAFVDEYANDDYMDDDLYNDYMDDDLYNDYDDGLFDDEGIENRQRDYYEAVIENEIDTFETETGIFNEEAIFEHLCRKFGYSDRKAALRESTKDYSMAIVNLWEAVSKDDSGIYSMAEMVIAITGQVPSISGSSILENIRNDYVSRMQDNGSRFWKGLYQAAGAYNKIASNGFTQKPADFDENVATCGKQLQRIMNYINKSSAHALMASAQNTNKNTNPEQLVKSLRASDGKKLASEFIDAITKTGPEGAKIMASKVGQAFSADILAAITSEKADSMNIKTSQVIAQVQKASAQVPVARQSVVTQNA